MHFGSKLLGQTLLDRLLVSLDTSLNYERALQVFLNNAEKTTLEELEQLDPGRLKGIPDNELVNLALAFSSFYHEMWHVRQASNSSFGFYLAANQRLSCLRVMVKLRELRDRGMTSLTIPLLAKGSHVVAAPAQFDREMSEFMRPIRMQLRQLDELSGIPGQTIREVLLHQKELRSLVPTSAQITTNRDLNDPASPYGLTAQHLMEAEARFIDVFVLGFLQRLGVPLHISSRALTSLAQDDQYTFALDVYCDILGLKSDWGAFSPQFFFALQFALWPALNTEGSFWEELQPAWRFIYVCEFLKNMKFEVNFLNDFLALSHGLSEGLHWYSPAQAMTDRANDTFRAGDILIDDLYDRHEVFCKEVLDSGAIPLVLALEPSGFGTRFEPWFMEAHGRFLFMNYPKNSIPESFRDKRVQYIGHILMEHSFAKDLLYAGNFDQSESLFHRMRNHLLVRGEWSEERMKYEWEESIGAIVTDFGKLSITYL